MSDEEVHLQISPVHKDVLQYLVFNLPLIICEEVSAGVVHKSVMLSR